MPKSQRPDALTVARCLGAVAVAVVLAGCASLRSGSAGPAAPPGEVYRSLLGHNAGLSAVRAVAETRISFAGQTVSLPGVLNLDGFGGFRLDLLDPLDRPLAVLFVESRRIVHYRPFQGLAASLGVFPEECRGVDPADWVSAILASSVAPVAGESLVDRRIWGGGRVLERHRGGELHQSVRYWNQDDRTVPREFTWYCAEEPVLRVRLRERILGSRWRLPSRFEISYPKAGLDIVLELSEVEGNPPPSSQPLRPRLGSEIRWTTWNLPR